MPVLQAVRGNGGAGMSDMQMISRGIESNGGHGYDHDLGGTTERGRTLSDLNPGF